MDDRRRINPRLAIELPAEYQVDKIDRPRPGTIANLSAGGAAVLTSRQLPPHSILDQFRFFLNPEESGESPLDASAVVVHARPYLNHQGSIEYCSGLHFLGLRTSAFERLEHFVTSRLEVEEG